MTPPPCIACGKRLAPAFSSSPDHQPNDGVMFTTRGTYGSTLYDDVGGGTRLLIVVCDLCLYAAGQAGGILEIAPPVPVRSGITVWEPGEWQPPPWLPPDVEQDQARPS